MMPSGKGETMTVGSQDSGRRATTGGLQDHRDAAVEAEMRVVGPLCRELAVRPLSGGEGPEWRRVKKATRLLGELWDQRDAAIDRAEQAEAIVAGLRQMLAQADERLADAVRREGQAQRDMQSMTDRLAEVARVLQRVLTDGRGR